MASFNTHSVQPSFLIPLPTPPAEPCSNSSVFCNDSDPTSTAVTMISPPSSSTASSCCTPSRLSGCTPRSYSTTPSVSCCQPSASIPISSPCCPPQSAPLFPATAYSTRSSCSPRTSEEQVPTTLISGLTLEEIECCIIESVAKEGMSSTCCQDLIPHGIVLSRFPQKDLLPFCATPSSRANQNATACCTKHGELLQIGGGSTGCEAKNVNTISPFTAFSTPVATPPISVLSSLASSASDSAAAAMATSGTEPIAGEKFSLIGTEKSTWEMDPVHSPPTNVANTIDTTDTLNATVITNTTNTANTTSIIKAATSYCSPSLSPCATAATTSTPARKTSLSRSICCEPPSTFQAQQGGRSSPTSPPCSSSSSTSNAYQRRDDTLIGHSAIGCAATGQARVGSATVIGSTAPSTSISHPVADRFHSSFPAPNMNLGFASSSSPSSARDHHQPTFSSSYRSRSPTITTTTSTSFMPLSPVDSLAMEEDGVVRCQWYGCVAEFVSLTDLWSHLSEVHVALQQNFFPTLCQWESCLAQQPNHSALLWHLQMEHHIQAPITPQLWTQPPFPFNIPHSLHTNQQPRQPQQQQQQQQQSQQPPLLQQQHEHVVRPQHRQNSSSISSTSGSISGSSALISELPHLSLSSPPTISNDIHHERAVWGTSSSPETSPFVMIKQEEEQQQPHQLHHQQQNFNNHHYTLTPLQEQLLQQSHHHPCLWADCRLAFPTFDALTSHLSEEHIGMGKSEYICEWVNCDRRGRGFGQRQKAMRHIQTHTGDKPFQCQVCQKRFSEANIMAQHMRTHTGEKPFKCDEPGCGRQFSISGALTIHRRVHTGEKPFKCKFEGCDKWFAESSNLTKHLRVHTGERPFQCPFIGCDKRFSRPDQVTRHKKTHMTDAEKMAVLKAEKVAEMKRRA